MVLDRLRAFVSSRTDIGDALTPLDLEARAFDAALGNAFTLSKRWLAMPPVEMKTLVLDIVERVTIAANRIEIWLADEPVSGELVCEANSLLTGKITGNFTKIGPFGETVPVKTQQNQLVTGQFPTK